jgi:hypothetical protein
MMGWVGFDLIPHHSIPEWVPKVEGKSECITRTSSSEGDGNVIACGLSMVLKTTIWT